MYAILCVLYWTHVYVRKSRRRRLGKKVFMSQVKKEEGKFVELPGAEMGKVVTRFPPEASGWGTRAPCNGGIESLLGVDWA